MILPQQKLLFVHIPKTAGQSIYEFLFENINVPYTLDNSSYGLISNQDLSLPGPQQYHHLFFKEYIKFNLINEDDICNYNIFTFVRNPYERFKSAFYYRYLHKEYSYETFLTDVYPTLSENDDLYRHFCPQHLYIEGCNSVNIYKLEDGFKPFMCDLKTMLKLTHKFVKKNNQSSYKKPFPFTHRNISLLNKVYANDFKRFNYSMHTPGHFPTAL